MKLLITGGSGTLGREITKLAIDIKFINRKQASLAATLVKTI